MIIGCWEVFVSNLSGVDVNPPVWLHLHQTLPPLQLSPSFPEAPPRTQERRSLDRVSQPLESFSETVIITPGKLKSLGKLSWPPFGGLKA